MILNPKYSAWAVRTHLDQISLFIRACNLPEFGSIATHKSSCGLIEKFVDQISSHEYTNNIKLEELKKACKTEEDRKVRVRMEDSEQIVLSSPCVSLCCNHIHGKLDMDVPKKQPCNPNRLCQMRGCCYSCI